jgi:hypothetical protein
MSSKDASGTPHMRSHGGERLGERIRGERPLMSFSLCRHMRGNQWRLCARATTESKRGLTARAGSAVRAVHVTVKPRTSKTESPP